VQVQIEKLAAALQLHGVFDRSGKLRGHWLDRLDRFIGTALAIDRVLGLKRAPKPVESIDDVIAELNEKERVFREQDAARRAAEAQAKELADRSSTGQQASDSGNVVQDADAHIEDDDTR
jgi:hypothetical protein